MSRLQKTRTKDQNDNFAIIRYPTTLLLVSDDDDDEDDEDDDDDDDNMALIVTIDGATIGSSTLPFPITCPTLSL